MDTMSLTQEAANVVSDKPKRPYHKPQNWIIEVDGIFPPPRYSGRKMYFRKTVKGWKFALAVLEGELKLRRHTLLTLKATQEDPTQMPRQFDEDLEALIADFDYQIGKLVTAQRRKQAAQGFHYSVGENSVSIKQV